MIYKNNRHINLINPLNMNSNKQKIFLLNKNISIPNPYLFNKIQNKDHNNIKNKNLNNNNNNNNIKNRNLNNLSNL